MTEYKSMNVHYQILPTRVRYDYPIPNLPQNIGITKEIQGITAKILQEKEEKSLFGDFESDVETKSMFNTNEVDKLQRKIYTMETMESDSDLIKRKIYDFETDSVYASYFNPKTNAAELVKLNQEKFKFNNADYKKNYIYLINCVKKVLCSSTFVRSENNSDLSDLAKLVDFSESSIYYAEKLNIEEFIECFWHSFSSSIAKNKFKAGKDFSTLLFNFLLISDMLKSTLEEYKKYAIEEYGDTSVV